MMQIFEQEEFLGLAREGKAQDNPYTSRMELNTETQEDSLNRLKGRQPYIASKFPANAMYFNELNKSLIAKTYGNASVTSLYSNTAFEAAVCFKWDGVTDTSPTAYTIKNIFGAVSGPSYAWGIVALYTASQWKCCGVVAQTSDPAVLQGWVVPVTAVITQGTWYWAKLAVSGNSGTLSIYENGSTTTAESVTNAALARSALTGTFAPVPQVGGMYV